MSARTLLLGALAATALVQPAQAKGFIALSTRNAGPLIAWYKSTFDLTVAGTIFDGNIHSLGGNFAYDPQLNRSVSVSAAAISEVLGKVYGLQALTEELERR